MAPNSSSSLPRRSSGRIKKLTEEAAAAAAKKKPLEQDDDFFGDVKKPRTRKTTTSNNSLKNKQSLIEPRTPPVPEEGGVEQLNNNNNNNNDDDEMALVQVENQNQGESSGSVVRRPMMSDTAKIIQAIRSFNTYYLLAVQEEETRFNIRQAELKVAEITNANQIIGAKSNVKRGSKRPDLKAADMMKKANTLLNTDKRIGPIPGVNAGFQFYSRCEMVVVGFHSHWLSGIDYIGESAKGFKGYNLPLAIAIVLSGQYEDDLDNSDDVVYTGSGGNDLLGRKHQIADQKMERGNLALKNCIEQGTSVRVIRGHQCRSSYSGKIYTYDGLYKVDSFWAEKGLSGFTVFKYRLKRIDGQPLLTTNQVNFINGHVPTSSADARRLVCEDIAGGLENHPICATNTVDEPSVPPTDYTYHRTMIVAKNVKPPRAAIGCGCKGSCTDPKKCACARLNGSDFPYVQRDGGRLIEPKSVVFECGPNCGCGIECVNRTSQRGIRFKLEVFRTPKKGWGVRSWDFIPSGSPICEYIGELMRTEDTDCAHENFYIIDCDTLETMKGLGGRQRRLGDVSLPAYMLRNDENRIDSDPEYCVDASTRGNVARYMNHSCQPNVFIQSVLSSHHELSQARIVFFAADNIQPLTELTYDYGYVIDSVVGPDGKPKNVACCCGADDCRKRLI